MKPTTIEQLAKKWEAEIKKYDDDFTNSFGPEDWMAGHRECLSELLEIPPITRGFSLEPEEMDKISKWVNDHNCVIKYEGAVAGKITYSFTPMSLGLVTKVSCACGKELDVTDYKSW